MKFIQHLIHPAVTLLALILGGAPLGILTVAFWLGREIAQAEYRWIERYGQGKRANMPWYASIDKKVWDFHSFFWNLTAPALLVLVFCILQYF
jgi:hypothetical protein